MCPGTAHPNICPGSRHVNIKAFTSTLVLWFDFHAYLVVTNSREICPTQVGLEGLGFQAGRRATLSTGASPEHATPQKPERGAPESAGPVW